MIRLNAFFFKKNRKILIINKNKYKKFFNRFSFILYNINIQSFNENTGFFFLSFSSQKPGIGKQISLFYHKKAPKA